MKDRYRDMLDHIKKLLPGTGLGECTWICVTNNRSSTMFTYPIPELPLFDDASESTACILYDMYLNCLGPTSYDRVQ